MQAPMQRPAGCRALLPTGAGELLTGSSDGAVRLWDASRPEASYMVCGPPQMPAAEVQRASLPMGAGRAQAGQHMPAQATVPVSYAYTHKTVQGVDVVEESCIPRSAEPPVSLLRRCLLHHYFRNLSIAGHAGSTHCLSPAKELRAVSENKVSKLASIVRLMVMMLCARSGTSFTVGWTGPRRCAIKMTSPT